MGSQLRLRVNGEHVEVSAPPTMLVVDLLRDTLGLTGTKASCRVGACGACSILLDGELVSACLLPVFAIEDREVWTIEGLSQNRPLMGEIQTAFVRCGAFQCGYCTPGQLVAAYALLTEYQRPEREDVRAWMDGNLCRCTGYDSIDAAVMEACSASSPEPRTPDEA